MFFKHFQVGLKTILIIYIDDIIRIGDDLTDIERLKRVFAIKFEVRDLRTNVIFL